MTTLYKKDSKGSIRMWEVKTDGCKLIQKSGLIYGAKTIHSKECKHKNIGRSNETTSSYQAILEMESLITNKLTTGYFRTIEEAQKGVIQLPMLAKSFDKEKHNIKNHYVDMQPKLDGMRCLAHLSKTNGVKLISRDGKEIDMDILKHIVDELKEVCSKLHSDLILDGELYCHGENFQSNMKMIKKYRKGETERIKYHVYDCCSEYKFQLRFSAVEDILNYDQLYKNLLIVETKTILINGIKSYHSNCIDRGYEGSMVRYGDKGYEFNKRSSSLLKKKDFIDIQLPIVDIIPNEVYSNQGTPIFYHKGAKGHRYGDDHFGAGVKMSWEDREDILINKSKYIGKMAEIRFFEYSDLGVPRFPIMVGIRLDK